MHNERSVEFGQPTIKVTTGGQHQPASASSGGQRERPVQRMPPGLQLLGQRGRPIKLTQLHQRIQLPPDQARPGRLTDTHLAKALQQRAKFGVRCLGVALRQGQKAQN